jgi:hypothetical protein
MSFAVAARGRLCLEKAFRRPRGAPPMRPAATLALVAFLAIAAASMPGAKAQGACNPTGAALTLEPGQGCHPPPQPLGKGDALVFSWQVTQPPGALLHFSTHIHVGAELVNLSEEDAGGKSGRLVADRDGLYSMLWLNDGNGTVDYQYLVHAERSGARTSFPWFLGPSALALAAAFARGRR